MTILPKIGWVGLAILCAIAFGHVAGFLNPHEKVNGLWLVVAASCFYVLAYRFYGRFLARRVMNLDDSRRTPAYRLEDGTNFYPANKYILGLLPTKWVDLSEKLSERLAKEEVGGFSIGRKVAQIS